MSNLGNLTIWRWNTVTFLLFLNYQSCVSQVHILMNRLFGCVLLDLSQRQFDMYLPKSVPSQNVFMLLVLNSPFTSSRISAVG